MNRPTLVGVQYEDLLRRALSEDLGPAGDITTAAVVPEGACLRARLVLRAAGRLAGLEPALTAFRLLDSALRITPRAADGDDLAAGAVVAEIEGAAAPILGAERVALNLLGRLCGIATATRSAAEAAGRHGARVVCTRKTTPGLRSLEKYAVRVGGGVNHRFGLGDGILIKDNHRVLGGGVAESVRRARAAAGHMVKVEVEVDDLDQLDEALAAGADIVLLDNFTRQDLVAAVERVGGRAVTEASGGVSPESLEAVAATGVDLISMGWLTHSAPALDVALDVEPCSG